MLLALTVLSVNALAEEPTTDLVQMKDAYGFRTVATVVQASTQGDVSLSEAHVALDELGLGRLKVPVERGSASLALTACGWNDAVVCKLDLPAGQRAPEALACVGGRTVIADVPALSIVVTVEPTDTTAGEAWVSDLLPCWRAGGDRVRIVRKPGATVPLEVTAEGPAAEAATEALAPLADALRVCGPGTLVWETDDNGRPNVIRVDQAGGVHKPRTACVQDVLGKEKLPGAVKLTAELIDGEVPAEPGDAAP